LRAALQQLARLVEIPGPQTSIEAAKTESQALIEETAKGFEQARRYAELTQFEFEESPDRDRTSLGDLESTLSRAEEVFVAATSLTNDQAWNEWQKLPAAAKNAESVLREVAAKRIERVATGDVAKETDADLSTAFDTWNETVRQLRPENSRNALVSRIATEAQRLG
jgi:hypothetical protein